MHTDPEEDYKNGSIPFLGVTIFLDSKPLIPRTETEYWVEQAITEIRKSADVRRPQIRVLDLFAGSGAIGLAVLKHVPEAHVTFGDINPLHFPTIKKSISTLLTSDVKRVERAECVKTDVWSAVPPIHDLPMGDALRHPCRGFDVVLANPPYVSKERSTASPSVIAHEPEEALFSADDGFFYIEKTIEGLGVHLKKGGVCWIEHEPFHSIRIQECADVHNLSATTYKDQYGIERFSKIYSSYYATIVPYDGF